MLSSSPDIATTVLWLCGLLVATCVCAHAQTPSLHDALASGRDLWGEQAMARPDGPGLAYFQRLLPPLRYVNTPFRHYPIPLSALGAAHKVRLVSNGSAVDAPAHLETWYDAGLFPVYFGVGPDAHPYGERLADLDGPRYADGYLPIVQMDYRDGDCVYRQEAFAAADPPFDAANTTLFVRFTLRKGRHGQITARIGDDGAVAAQGAIREKSGRIRAWYGAGWAWEAAERRLSANLEPGQSVTLAVMSPGLTHEASLPALDEKVYRSQRRRCAAFWRDRIRSETRIETPEPYVNRAYRSLLVGTLMMAVGDTPNYSAQNIYAVTFEAECGDAIRGLLLFGVPDVARYVEDLLRRPLQAGIGVHDTAFKLQLLAHYYRLTGDTALVRRYRPLWTDAVRHIEGLLDPKNGLAPPERYCGDIAQQVYTLNSNANLWRGLRDMSTVLDEMGERDEARHQREMAVRLRRKTLAAVAASIRRDVEPPFVPVGLFGAEQPYETLTASMQGSYWNLMAPYLLGSGVFGVRAQESRWILDTMETRGGICMGMPRFHQHSGLFANENAVDDLYGLRYVVELLQRDEVDRALVSFYGKLAQGLTRDTFIGGEGTGLEPLDAHGRAMYLPPNISGNGFSLWTLRYLLVQDWDDDDDGVPETLHLLYATPRSWLRDGATLRVENAPTMFGKASVTVQSHLARGEVLAEVVPPPHAPRSMKIRFRLPQGWEAVEARVNGAVRAMGVDETLDLTGQEEALHIVLTVRKRSR